jgi:hypothetical protein
MKANGPQNIMMKQLTAKLQLTAMLLMLLFLFIASGTNAGDINTPDNPVTITLTEQELTEANDFALANNTLFSFFIPKNEYVRLSIFDVNGKELAVLIDDNKKAGEFSAELKKANLTKGTYYYRLVVGKYKEVRRLNIIK